MQDLVLIGRDKESRLFLDNYFQLMNHFTITFDLLFCDTVVTCMLE